MSKVATIVGLGLFFLLLATPEGQALAKSMLQSAALGSETPTNSTVPVIAGDGSVGSDLLVRGLVYLAFFAAGMVCMAAACFACCCLCLCLVVPTNSNERQPVSGYKTLSYS